MTELPTELAAAGGPYVQPEDIGPTRPRLAAALSWSMIGGLGAGGALFAQSIAAGRYLGPTEYGTFSLIQACAMVALIFSLAGFDMSSSRALARAADSAEQRRVAASSIVAVLTCAAVAGAILAAAASPLAQLLGTTRPVIYWGCGFTAALALRWLLERHLSGLGRFRQQAAVRLLEAAAVIAVFVGLSTAGGLRDYRALVIAYTVGALVVVGGSLLADGHSLRPGDVSRRQIRQLARYGGLMNASYLFATLLFQADRFVVNSALGSRELGIYTSYYSSTIFIVIQVLLIVSNVLYPMISNMGDKRSLVARLDRLAPIAFVGGGAALLGLSAVVLWLFGSAYPYDITLASVFCAWAALAACNGIYAIVVNAHSERACAREVAFQPVRVVFVVTWLSAFVAAGHLTLTSAVVGVLLGEILETCNLRHVLRTHVLVDSAGDVAG